MFIISQYVGIPSEVDVVQMMQQSSADSYVFCAPETVM